MVSSYVPSNKLTGTPKIEPILQLPLEDKAIQKPENAGRTREKTRQGIYNTTKSVYNTISRDFAIAEADEISFSNGRT